MLEDDGALGEFTTRLLDDWLPAFCNARSSEFAPEGFVRASLAKLAAFDARWFLRAIDAGLVVAHADGSFTAPQSKAKEWIFWSGLKSISPRPFTLALEPVITIGALARLHDVHGWPRRCLGMQAAYPWPFDLIGYADGSDQELLVCEVKKDDRQLSALVSLMKDYARIEPLPAEPTDSVKRNAYRKIAGVRRTWPPVLWAVGPSGSQHVFGIRRNGASALFDLVPVRPESLNYLAKQGG